MSPRWVFGTSLPSCHRSALAACCPQRCAFRNRSGSRSVHWLTQTRASTLIDRPPANKPKLSYVGATIAAAAIDGLCPGKAEWQQTIDKSNLQAPPLTKQDAAFEKEGCQFVWGLNELTVEDLNSLFKKVGFPQRDPARLKMALDNSHIVLWIRSMKQSRWARQGQLLGFARATSDGALNATIWDVAVNPSWQRSGLGRGLVERLTAQLVSEDITIICLYAEPDVIGLYNRLGFVANPEGIRGMAFQKTSKAGKALAEQAKAVAAETAAATQPAAIAAG